MSEPSSSKKRFRVWITLSEAVGVLALIVAALGFWDSHRERTLDARREAAADRTASGRAAFIMSGEMQADGARLKLTAINTAQAIQSQRYTFPSAVLSHAMQVSAAEPQIDVAWIADGLRRQVALARRSGAGADGEASIPVGVATSFVEDGEMRTDASLYRLGYAWRGRLLGGPRLALQGVSLLRRSVRGDMRQAVDASFTAEHPAASAR